MIWILLRWFFYALLLAGCASLMSHEAGLDVADRFMETGLTEHAQLSLALIIVTLMLAHAGRHHTWRPVSIQLAGLFLMLSIRELDWFTDTYIGDHTWQLAVTAVLIWQLIYAWQIRHNWAETWQRFSRTVAFGVIAAGTLVLVVYSRLFGREFVWEAVMGAGYQRIVKNTAEESIELLGFVLVLVGSIELWLQTRKKETNEH